MKRRPSSDGTTTGRRPIVDGVRPRPLLRGLSLIVVAWVRIKPKLRFKRSAGLVQIHDAGHSDRAKTCSATSSQCTG